MKKMIKEKKKGTHVSGEIHEKISKIALSRKCSIEDIIDNMLERELKIYDDYLDDLNMILDKIKDMNNKFKELENEK